MIKALFRHFMDTNWVMKIVLAWAWISALIMVLALVSPYYQLVISYWHL